MVVPVVATVLTVEANLRVGDGVVPNAREGLVEPWRENYRHRSMCGNGNLMRWKWIN